MSWFALKKAKTIVYVPSDEYSKYINQYAEMKGWSLSDKISLHIAGSKQNKEKKRINKLIINSMTNEWNQDRTGFRAKHSFVYHADSIENHLYELIWSFCEFNPRYQMMVNREGRVFSPTYVDINLSVTFGKDFYVGEFCKRRNNMNESQYRIKTDTITVIYGDMMDFRIGFENGSEYHFQTLFDGRKTSGSISTGMGDLSKWKTMLQKAEVERLARQKANAPARIITTDEFQRTTLSFAQDACEDFYEEMLDIEKNYEHYAMVPNVSVDFSVYEKKWLELANRAKIRYDEVTEYSILWSKQPNRDFPATALYGVMMDQTWSFYHSICLYSEAMSQMMHHLFEKSNGGKYRMKDYQKELHDTEVRRPSDYSYNDVKKRWQDQMKHYQEQTNNDSFTDEIQISDFCIHDDGNRNAENN